MATRQSVSTRSQSGLKQIGIATPTASQDSANKAYVDSTVVPLSSTTPAAETFGVTGEVGVGTTAARSDHVHAMPVVTLGAMDYSMRTVTTGTTVISITDEIVFVPTNIHNVQLPSAVTAGRGKVITVKSLGSGVHVTSAGGIIDSGTTNARSIPNLGSRAYASDGTDWWVV